MEKFLRKDKFLKEFSKGAVVKTLSPRIHPRIPLSFFPRTISGSHSSTSPGLFSRFFPRTLPRIPLRFFRKEYFYNTYFSSFLCKSVKAYSKRFPNAFKTRIANNRDKTNYSERKHFNLMQSTVFLSFF